MFAFPGCLVLPLILKIMQIFEEQDPRGLFDIVQLVGNAVFGSEVLLDGIEGVFVHDVCV